MFWSSGYSLTFWKTNSISSSFSSEEIWIGNCSFQMSTLTPEFAGVSCSWPSPVAFVLAAEWMETDYRWMPLLLAWHLCTFVSLKTCSSSIWNIMKTKQAKKQKEHHPKPTVKLPARYEHPPKLYWSLTQETV